MRAITNIFCIIGKPGTGKRLILNNIFSNIAFVNEFHLKRFVYGTTRKMGTRDINGITYHFYSKQEFDDIDPKEIIESRSYDNVNTGETEYFFTLREHIEFGNNYLGVVSTFQYEEIKKWANVAQFTVPNHCINVYPIYIKASLPNRMQTLLKRAMDDSEIYMICGKILSERYEYSTLLENKVIDKFNPNSCVIDHYNDAVVNEKYITSTITRFIKEHIDDGQ